MSFGIIGENVKQTSNAYQTQTMFAERLKLTPPIDLLPPDIFITEMRDV